jgi:hypothetical protein
MRTGAETQTSPNDESQRCVAIRAKQSQVVSEVEEKAGTTEDGKLVASNVSRERASMQACVPIVHPVRCLIASDNQAASSTAA